MTASKRRTFAFALGLALLAGSARAELMAYPTSAKPSFLIDMPKNWELTQGEEEGDYVDVTGPTGVVLSFRTIPGSEKAMNGAIKESIEWLNENYSNVELDDPEDSEQNGLSGFYATGSGADEDGNAVVFGMAWYALPNGKIGEIWFAADPGDKAGITAAGKILDSFRAP